MKSKKNDFKKKVNADIAYNNLIFPIILICISTILYLPQLTYFPVITLIIKIIVIVFLLLARFHIKYYATNLGKIYMFLSISAIIIQLVVDCFILYMIIDTRIVFVPNSYYFIEKIFTMITIPLLFKINRNLFKADNPEKFKDSTDWFYEDK